MVESRFATVFRLFTSPQADLCLSVLEANGINAYLDADAVGSLYPPTALGAQGICIRVPVEEAERAVAILQEHPEASSDLPEPVYEEDEDEPEDDEEAFEEEEPEPPLEEVIPECCPNCGSAQIGRLRQSMVGRVLLTILFLGLPLIAYWLNGPPPTQWICQDCEWQWTP